MGIRGLHSYVTQSPENFTPFLLHNTYLVVDAENFVNHRYRTSGLVPYYGGEQMDFLVSMRIFLRQLQKCRIKPIFVFDGCHEEKGTKRETLLKRNMERIPILSTFIGLAQLTIDTDQVDCAVDVLPKLTNQTALDLLDECGIPHICCIREADVRIAELAVFLDCPLLSNDSDFYLFQSPYPSRYRIVPLISLGFEYKQLPNTCSTCATHSSKCYGMPCSILCPTHSSLNRVSPSLLPLMAVLLGNDVISCVRFPNSVDILMKTSAKMPYNAKRVGSVLQWLSRFPNDASSPLRELFSGYPTSSLDQLTKQIVQCIRGYHLDPTTGGSELTNALGLSSVSTLVHCPLPRASHVDLNSTSINTVDEAVFVVGEVLSYGRTNECDPDAEFCHLWPLPLIRSFRNGQISTSLLDALYVQGGTVLRILFENLNIQQSIYSVTERMRALEYRLFIELESCLGCSHKLRWLTDGKPVENRRDGSQMCTYSVSLPTFTFLYRESAVQAFEQFFRQHLCVDLRSIVCDSPDTVTVACILVLWFRSSSSTEISRVSLTANPVALVFVACAMVNGVHYDYLRQQAGVAADRALAELCEGYVRLASDAKRERLSRKRHSYSIEIVHQFNELQLVYLELKQLTNLLDIFCTRTGRHNTLKYASLPSRALRLSFWPGWVVFPSGRLFYWLTQALISIAPNDRFSVLQARWIPALLHAAPYSSALPHASQMSQRVWHLLEVAQRMLGR